MPKQKQSEYIPTQQYTSGLFHLRSTYETPPAAGIDDPVVKIGNTFWVKKETKVCNLFIYGDLERSYDTVMAVVDGKIVAPIRQDALFDIMMHGKQQGIVYEQRYAYPIKHIGGQYPDYKYSDDPVLTWGYYVPGVNMTYRLRGTYWTVWPKK